MTSQPKVFTNTSEKDPEVVESQDDPVVESWNIISTPSTSSGTPDHVVPSSPVQIAGQPDPRPDPDKQRTTSQLVAGNTSRSTNTESQSNKSIMIVTSSKSAVVSGNSSAIVVLDAASLPPPPSHYSHNDEGRVIVCGSLTQPGINKDLLERNLSIDSYGSGQGQPSNDDRDADSPTSAGDGTIPNEDVLDGLFQELEASGSSNPIETTNTVTMDPQSESLMPTVNSSPSSEDTDVSPIEGDEESTSSLASNGGTRDGQHKEATYDGQVEYVKPENTTKSHSNLMQDNDYLMVQLNGDLEVYTHDSQWVNETTPLIPRHSNRRRRRRKLLYPAIIIYCVIFCFLLLAILGVVLYEMRVFDGLLPHNNTNNN